jgi:hypothetical protein
LGGVGSWKAPHAHSYPLFPIPVSALQLGRQFAGPADDRARDAGQLGDMDAVRAISPAAPQLVQNTVLILLDCV